jgi:hypothetical protein
MTGAELRFEDRRSRRKKRTRSEHRRQPAQMPTICWRCNKERALQGRATCERCLEFITAKAAQIKEGHRRAREEWQ